PARMLCTTAELSMTFLGAPMRTGGVITARAGVIRADDGTGLSEVSVTDQEERLVAHATSRCSIIGAPGDTAEPPPIPPAPPDSPDESPDPYLRPVSRSSATFSEAERLRMGGLDLLRAQLESPATRPPIDRLTGIRLLEAGEGRAAFAMPPRDWLRDAVGSADRAPRGA